MFCEETLCWRDDMDPVPTSSDMQFDLPGGARIVRILGVTLDGRNIEVEFDGGSTLASRLAGNSGCTRLRTTDRVNFSILPTPCDDLDVVVSAALTPTDDAAGIPDEIGDAFGQNIAHGALSTLLVLRDGWRDVQLAAYYDGKFRSAIASTAIRAARGFSNTRPRARVRTF